MIEVFEGREGNMAERVDDVDDMNGVNGLIDDVSNVDNSVDTVDNSSDMIVKTTGIINSVIGTLQEDYKANKGFSENGYKLLIAYLEYTSGTVREFIGAMDKMCMDDGVKMGLLNVVYSDAKNLECMMDFME